jgi:hypothetical protein
LPLFTSLPLWMIPIGWEPSSIHRIAFHFLDRALPLCIRYADAESISTALDYLQCLATHWTDSIHASSSFTSRRSAIQGSRHLSRGALRSRTGRTQSKSVMTICLTTQSLLSLRSHASVEPEITHDSRCPTLWLRRFSRHRTMLPLNLCPEHYMFLLTQSRKPRRLLAPGGSLFKEAPATYASRKVQGRCNGIQVNRSLR